MSRISIDVSDEQHQKIKAMAALQGKSIKNFVLDRTLNTMDEDNALAELEALLDERIDHAQKGKISKRPIMDVFQEVYSES
jgi:uncharacterized protein (DUF1778 family)